MPAPKAFLSYSWDDDAHKEWVRELAGRLRGDGIETVLDDWELLPGDQLPAFMERAVRESDFVLIVCTPRYKVRSEGRAGGVGYEGDIMTAEVMTQQNHRKFIPILRKGKWEESAPGWLLGKYHLDLSGSPYSQTQYDDLVMTLLGRRKVAPPVKSRPATKDKLVYTFLGPSSGDEDNEDIIAEEFQPIEIEGIIVDEVGEPRNDGSRGSALYDVPFRLSQEPPPKWDELFIESWNHPPRYTSMHRPGIASVFGDRIVLDGTTIDEVQRYHRDTLALAVDEANQKYQQHSTKRRQKAQSANAQRQQHRNAVADIAGKIRFD